MNFFVTELRFLQDFRLKLELDELFDTLSLQQELRAFLINGDAQLVFLGKEKRVWPRSKLEAKIAKQIAKLRGLFSCEPVSVGSHCFGPATVQRFPHQSEFCLPPSACLLVPQKQTRSSLAPNDRSLRHPRLRIHAPADPSRDRNSILS